MTSLYASITLTEAQAFQAIGNYLQAVLPPACQVTRGALNRVPEPLPGDFVTMMQIGQKRLAWNDTTFIDDILTASVAPADSTFDGSITGFVLTVTSAPSQAILIGTTLSGAGVGAGTTITAQLTGTAGQQGAYQVSVFQQLPNTAMTASWGVLTVTALPQQQGPLVPGMLLTDQTMVLAAGTLILQQLTGSPTGGVGTYAVSVSQTVTSETMYAGLRLDLVQTQLSVQIDVHGPNSGNNAKIIEGLFFSEAAYDQFETSGYDVHPLYCDDPRQTPFVNDQQQIEWRYSVDAHVQINPSINSWQQFADQIEVTTHVADAVASGGVVVIPVSGNVQVIGVLSPPYTLPTGVFGQIIIALSPGTVDAPSGGGINWNGTNYSSVMNNVSGASLELVATGDGQWTITSMTGGWSLS